ncbi:hypothetical protein SEA_PEANAM_92 [Mycobacterium phage Peanam]|nr:hypothetical protein SEA_PEANAM_92 [Mycobacterium phage Peanam]
MSAPEGRGLAEHIAAAVAASGKIVPGARVADASVVQRYGLAAARVGTVLRVYDAPAGMVEVRWDADPLDADEVEPVENAWADELTTV